MSRTDPWLDIAALAGRLGGRHRPVRAIISGPGAAQRLLAALPCPVVALSARAEPARRPGPDPGPAVLVEGGEERLRLTLNRPPNRNAMSMEMRDAPVEARP